MALFDMMSEELKWYFWEGYLKLVHLYLNKTCQECFARINNFVIISVVVIVVRLQVDFWLP